MSGKSTINLTLSAKFWGRLSAQELYTLGQQLDASAADSVIFEEPDALPDEAPWRWDASTGIGALVATTKRIRLILAVESSYSDPFTIARRIGSLDHLSNGRIGWIISPYETSEKNRLTRAVSHDFGAKNSLQRANELIHVCHLIWDSWQEGALALDVANNCFVKESLVKRVEFQGAHFRISGQVNLPRPPSGRPPLYMRVTSTTELTWALPVADVLLCAEESAIQTIEHTSPKPSVQVLHSCAPTEAALAQAQPKDLLIHTQAELSAALQALRTTAPSH